MRLLAANVGIDRGGRRILSGVTFTLDAGAALLVTGDNGTGKSSLLRTLAGYLAPSEGRVTFEDADAAPSLHYLGHRDGLKPQLTAAENLRFWRAFLGGGAGSLDPARALDVLDLAAAADKPVSWLSAGQRRRVALARLLVVRRPLWILDEPTTGLDARSIARFEAMAGDHLAAGGSIVAATHAPLQIFARELRLGPSDVQADPGHRT